MNIMIGMRRRFGRRRRSGGGGGSGSGSEDGRGGALDARWLERVVEAEAVPVTGLAPLAASDVPADLALVGTGVSADGARALVAVGRTGGDALLGGLAAATRLAESESFAGPVYVVAPAWSSTARRRLGVVGATPFSVIAAAAPELVDAPAEVEAEPPAAPVAVSPERLARHPVRPTDRELCRRALAGLAGLAAKHGGSLRGVGRTVELALLARRVAAIRVDDEGVLLDLFVEPRKNERLRADGLADALDRLEGSLRKHLNDRELRDGEEGFRARVIGSVAETAGLRAVERWPAGGQDADVIDAIGALADGQPGILAIRRQLGLAALGSILDAALALAPALPELLARAEAPLRLDAPRLVLAATHFDPAVLRVLATLTLDSAHFEVQDGGRDTLVRPSGEAVAARPLERGREGRGRGDRGDRGERGGRAREERDDRRRAPTGPDLREALLGGERPLAAVTEERREEPREEPREERRAPRPPAAAPRFEEVSLFDLGEEEPSSAAVGDEAGRGRGRRRRRRGRGRGRGGRRDEGGDSDEEGGDASGEPPRAAGRERADDGRDRGRRGGRPEGGRERAPALEPASDDALDDDTDLADDLLPLTADAPDLVEEVPEPAYDDEEEADEEADGEQDRARLERERRRRARLAKADPVPEPVAPQRPPRPRRAAVLAHADRDSVAAAVLLARDLRMLEGLWVYPQAELMTFFRGVAPDLRDETPIYVVGFTPSPAREVLQTASLYRDRLVWFDHHPWPPENVGPLAAAIGADNVHLAPWTQSALPLVLGTLTRRSRFSDKLVDLVTGRFTQHDFERWGRVWWTRLGDVASRTGDRRADVEALLVGRPSDLAREAAAVTTPALPAEAAHVQARDFRIVHFGGHALVVVPTPPPLDSAMCARIARERYAAAMSLAWTEGEETLVLAADDQPGRRALDVLGMTEHLASKHEWIEALPDADHVARVHVRGFAAHPERLEDVLAEIAMGRSILEG